MRTGAECSDTTVDSFMHANLAIRVVMKAGSSIGVESVITGRITRLVAFRLERELKESS